MCVTGIAFSTVSSAQAAPVTNPKAKVGATVTDTTPPPAPETGKAKPMMTGPAPLPPEEKGLPG